MEIRNDDLKKAIFPEGQHVLGLFCFLFGEVVVTEVFGSLFSELSKYNMLEEEIHL